jgi:hypothetical protein
MGDAADEGDDGESQPGVIPDIAARRTRRALRTTDPAFQSELDAYLQNRLRYGTGFMALASAALWVAGRLVNLGGDEPLGLDVTHPAAITHAVTVVLAALGWLLLRGRRLSGFALRAVDAVVVQSTIAACALIYLFSYRQGVLQLVPFLGLFLIARAVVVPSTAVRTLLLSLAAGPAILAIQWAHGRAWGRGGVALEGRAFHALVAWDQVILLMSVAVAALTSRVNFALRVRLHEAARIDRYVLEERIGSGGMGEVFRARHGLLRRPTAVKVLRPEIAGESSLRRFEHEVRQTARLTHPNTIVIYDFGHTSEGHFYYAMELLEGSDLDRIVRATGPFPASRALFVLDQACGALREAHGIGLIHRDVKPANILLCRRGGEHDVVKVMDFGLVKDTRGEAGTTGAGEICGTPLTLAPEAIRGRAVTAQADVYALGCVGYWLLTGRAIFDVEAAGDFLVAHVTRPPVPMGERVPGIPADLEAALMACLAKDPAERPDGVADLRARLRSCADWGRWSEVDAAAWWRTNGAGFGVGADAIPVADPGAAATRVEGRTPPGVEP